MFKKLDKINKIPNSEIFKKLKPIFEFKQKNRIAGLTREQKLEIQAVNRYYFNKIHKQSSFYSLDQWNKEFQKSQDFKKIKCEFPCIDFHKTKIFSREGGFGEKKKEFNNSIINNNNNAFKKSKFKNSDLYSKKENTKEGNSSIEKKEEKKEEKNEEKKEEKNEEKKEEKKEEKINE